MENKLVHWRDEIDVIQHDIGLALLYRDTIEMTLNIATLNPKIQNLNWFKILANVYIDSGTMTIRRHISKRKGSISFIRLLESIKSNQTLIEAPNIALDISELNSISGRVRIFSNKRIAHWDAIQILDTAIDVQSISEVLNKLEELVEKYYSLLNSGRHLEVKPHLFEPWHIIFEELWSVRNSEGFVCQKEPVANPTDG